MRSEQDLAVLPAAVCQVRCTRGSPRIWSKPSPTPYGVRFRLYCRMVFRVRLPVGSLETGGSVWHGLFHHMGFLARRSPTLALER